MTKIRSAGGILPLEADYLGHVIMNMNNMLGLDAAILTGEIAYRPELLLQKIKEKINGTITNPYRSVARAYLSDTKRRSNRSGLGGCD